MKKQINLIFVMLTVYNIETSQHISAYPEASFLQPPSIQVVKSCFSEVLVGSIASGATCLFAATPQVAVSLIVLAVAILAINTFARMAAIFFEWNLFARDKFERKNRYSDITETCRMIPPFLHALLYGTTGNIVIHEAGHFAAISLIHTHARPQISVDGLFMGSTTWLSGEYTAFGKFLGPLNSRLVIAAAGPLIAICFATIGIIIALQIGKTYPDLSKNIFFSSNFSIVNHIFYAFSALSANPKDLAHDFVLLWSCGIHPLAAAVSLIAIPAIALLVYSYNKKI